MSKANNDNYFDDLDLWSDTPVPRKSQNPYKAPPKKEEDLDDFFSDFGDPGQTQRKRRSSSRGRGTNRRGKSTPKLLAAAAALICVALVCILAGTFAGTELEQSSPSARVPESTVVPPMFTIEPDPAPSAPPAPTSPAPTSPAPTSAPQDGYRYFGRMLTAQQQKVYNTIRTGIANRDDHIGPFNVTNDEELQLVTQCIQFDYPEYFWFRGGWSGSYYDRDTYLEYTLEPLYEYSAQECTAYTAFVESATQPLLTQLAGKSDYEKVKGVYEYLIDHAAYDTEYYAKIDLYADQPDFKAKTIYDIFHDGLGVCEGYARATQYLLTKLGVETLYVTGMGGEFDQPKSSWEGHAWNIVRIDGIYYQVDTTWGDPVNEGGVQTKNFHHLNLTDEEMARRHERDNWNTYPACTDVRHNYYVREGNYLEVFSKETIQSWFQQAYAQGQPLEFKCANESVYREAYNWLITNEGFGELYQSVSYYDLFWYNSSDALYILGTETD